MSKKKELVRDTVKAIKKMGSPVKQWMGIKAKP